MGLFSDLISAKEPPAASEQFGEIARKADKWLEPEPQHGMFADLVKEPEKPVRRVGRPSEEFHGYQLDADNLVARFGKKIANSFAEIGETIISSPLSPIGIPQKETETYRGQAIQELEASGFRGSKAQAEQLIRSRAARLAATERVPGFDVKPAEGIPEKATDVAAGLTAFISQLALTKRALPKGTPDAVIWEVQNQLGGGIPGQGMVTRQALGQTGRIPTATAAGKVVKTGAESALFAGITKAMGGTTEDVIVSSLVPVAFNAWTFARQKHHIRSYERTLRQQASKSHETRLKQLKQGYEQQVREINQDPTKDPQQKAAMREVAKVQNRRNIKGAETILETDIRAVDKAVQAAKRAVYQDDAFAPAREKWEGERQKALKLIKSGNTEKIARGNAILDFIGKAAPVRREDIAKLPTTRAGEAVEAIKGVGEAIRHPVKTAEQIKAGAKPPVYEPPPTVTPPAPPAERPSEPGLSKAQSAAKAYRTHKQPELKYVPTAIWDEIERTLAEKLKGEENLADDIIKFQGRLTHDIDNIVQAAHVLDYLAEAVESGYRVTDTLVYDAEKGNLVVDTGRFDPTEPDPDKQPPFTHIEYRGQSFDLGIEEVEGAFERDAGLVALYDQIRTFLNKVEREPQKPEQVAPPPAQEPERVPGEVAEPPTAENIKSKLAALSKDARDKYESMLGTQPQPGQTIARFQFERTPGHALDIQQELIQAGLVRQIGPQTVEPVRVAAPEPTEAAPEVAEKPERKESIRERIARSKYSSDIIGEYVVPTATSGIGNRGPGKVQHVIGGKEDPKIKVDGYGAPHWKIDDFELIERPSRLEIARMELERTGETWLADPDITYKIDQSEGGWVVRETEGKFTTTHGGVGPGDRGRWSKEEAIDKAMQKIEGRIGPAETEKPPTAAPEKPTDIGTIDKINVPALSRAMDDKVVEWTLGGVAGRPASNTDVKKFVAGLYGVSASDLTPEKGYSHKKVQEAVEASIVRYARQIIERGRDEDRSSEQVFKQLQTLYENQPGLTSRTGTSIKGQAYSTPAPLAFLVSELADIDEDTQVYEPTAGTGMLLVGADPGAVVANELDPTRLALLKDQGFGTVTNVDARTAQYAGISDAVVMNPPFGKHEKTKIEGYKFTRIDHIIIANALKAMKKDGRGVMIFAAPGREGKYSDTDWVFGNYIYRNYNVIGDFEVSGDLYRRQGAGWPVRIIAVHGREKSEKSPPNKTKIRAKSWQETYNVVQGILQGEVSNIELPEGWTLKSEKGHWQVFNDSGTWVGEVIQHEDGSFGLRGAEPPGTEEEVGFPAEAPKFDNFADAMKALSNLAKKKAGTKAKIKRSKIDVVPTTPRKKRRRHGVTRRPTPPRPEEAEDVGPVREPTGRPPAPPVPEPIGEERPTERPGERRPTGEPTGERPGPGELAPGERPVSPEPAGEQRPEVSEGEEGGVQAEPVTEGAERPPVPEVKRKPKAPAPEERKPVGVVGLTVGKLQVPYKPASKAPPAKQNIPTYLEPHVLAGLNNLKREVGDIDDYVRTQLDYESNEQMWEHLSATQIDTVAMALDRIDKGKGFIIGHQTGVGKGRIAAAIIRREILRAHKPVFWTAKKDLFTPFYEDLIDVGLTEDQIRPIMMNTGVDILDPDANIVFEKLPDRRAATAAYNRARETGDYDLVLTTYHQINTEGRVQRGQLAGLGHNEIVIFDESHNAAGEGSNTGDFIQHAILPHVRGVAFMSATYAKRPESMILYGRTGLLDAFDGDVNTMMTAVNRGGEPYQEVIASTLARANSYIRTELDFTGVTYETTIDATHLDRDTARADTVTELLRDILEFDHIFNATVIEGAKDSARRVSTRSARTTVTHSNFAAVVHNAIKQMLLSLKIDETVSMAIRALKEGKRVFIGLENTMGSFLSHYVESKGYKPGDTITDFDYREVLRTMLKNVLRYRIKHPNGDVEVVYVSVESLPLRVQDAYKSVLDAIEASDIELSASPIDEIVHQLEEQGYKVGEITGRNMRLVKTGENEYLYETRGSAAKDKVAIRDQFNNGDMQVIVGNVAAAEGMSIHASEKFKNQQTRQMIVAQAHADINKFVQMLGRVNRTGQVVVPEYKILMTALPAEIRPAAVLEKKMRSLNANTSAKTKGAYQQKQIPDILNIYGEYLTARYLIENLDVLSHVGMTINETDYRDALAHGGYRGPWHEDKIAKRFTGKLAVLPVEKQQEFYDWIEPEYNSLIEYLNKTDQNELVSVEKDYKAQEISSRTIFVGEPGNVFQEPATIDKMSIKLEGRPMTVGEMKEFIKKVYTDAGYDSAGDYTRAMREKFEAAWEIYKKQQGEKLKDIATQAHSRSRSLMSHIQLSAMRRDSEDRPLVLLEIINTFDKKTYKQNPAAPSHIKLRAAIPHSAKTVTISLSQWSNLEAFYGNAERHFNVPPDLRTEVMIINGNIIAGMGVVLGAKGNEHIRPKIINYTMEDGTVRQGVLLPRTFRMDDLPSEIVMIPEAAVAYLMDGPSERRWLEIGEARIIKISDSQVYIEVPRSRARGMKYYGDTELTALTGEFETWQKAMRAVFNANVLPQVLNYLKGRGNSIKSDGDDPDTAREYNNTYRDRPEGDYEEEVGMPAAPRKIKTIKKAPAAPLKRREIISRRKIVKQLGSALGVPIRGVATHRKKFPGWYNKRTRGIRMRHVNDLRVATHEIGHHIDIYFNNEAAKKMSHAWYGIGAELVRLGKALYGRKRPKGGYKAEGYAEFVFGWLTGGIDLKKEAPRMLRFFEKDYLPNNSMMADILHTARDMIDKWKEQGAIARFDSQIGGKLKAEKTAWKRFSLWWQTSWSDVSAPLQRALQENIPRRSLMFGEKDPGFLYGHFTQTEGARARTFVMDHTTDIWGNVTGISLKKALAPVNDKIKEFIRFMIAKRTANLEMRDIHSGFDLTDAMYIIKEYDSPVFRKAAKEVTEWNHRLLEYLVESGALEQEAAFRMRQLNPVYVPFIRLFAPGEIRKKAPAGVGRGLIRRGKGVYKIVGSDRPVDDPLEMMIVQARRMISIAHKSMVARALAQLEGKYEGLAGMIERVPPPMRATTFSASQLTGQLASLGIDVSPGDLDDAMLTVFGNSPVYLGKEHIISVVVDGKRTWYQVAPELYRILEDMDQFQLPKILNLLLGKATRMMRLGATGLNAAFGLVRNPIRDALDTIPKAKYARGPVALGKGIIKDLSTTGMARSLGFNQNEAARRFIDLGGKLSGFLGQDRTSIQHLKGEMLAHTVAGKAIHTARHPVHAIREVFGVPETGLRVEEFEKALADWMKQHQSTGGEPPPDAIIYAFAMASDQTINYRKAGLYGRWLNSMIAFWNANAQDISKVYRRFNENPKQTVLWGLSTLTISALGLWWLHKDEEWYKELPSWEKANYIHVPIFKWAKSFPGVKEYKGDEEIDHILRIPVPFLMGHIFMSIPTTIIDSLYQQDPKRTTEFMGEFLDANIKPLFEWPALISPWLDVRRNKDWADRPIVPESLKGKLPEDQYRNYTSSFAKGIGKIFKISPLQIEYLLNGYSGGLYRRIGGTTERIAGKKQVEQPADWPLLGTLFTRDPYAPKTSLNRFYRKRDKLNQRYASDKLPSTDIPTRRIYNRVSKRLSIHLGRLREAKTENERRNIYETIKSLLEIVE
jgi:hypothetical protein